VSAQLHAPAAFYPRERAPGTHCIGSWVDPRAGLDDVEKWKFLPLPGLEPRPLSHPARSIFIKVEILTWDLSKSTLRVVDTRPESSVTAFRGYLAFLRKRRVCQQSTLNLPDAARAWLCRQSALLSYYGKDQPSAAKANRDNGCFKTSDQTNMTASHLYLRNNKNKNVWISAALILWEGGGGN
jgi:hypothetical protein